MQIWRCRDRSLHINDGMMMGIVNVTPDSFSDGGVNYLLENALRSAKKMILDGATFLDIGGESTRPGANSVSAEEEMKRVIPVIKSLRKEWRGFISIDTSKSKVARAAMEAGADIVNDVCGLQSEDMIRVCAEARCGVIIMHKQGNPQTMQMAPHYHDVVSEVAAFFSERFFTLTQVGITAENIVFDPGIGFGKSVEHNLCLLRSLENLSMNDRPLLLGVSRKSFIAKLLGEEAMTLRDFPTAAITAFAREKNVLLHRVHDVKKSLQAVKMIEAVMNHKRA